ncbi:MAG: exo-alpha-sialidase [Spirochaetaceae bacterium]|nr:MAG: exo-alpha-sialidase [Spirochaetaceae bacterium]
MARVELTMDAPIVVALSAPGETRWGYHQFPALSRLPDGSILLAYSDAADAPETHGAPAPCYRSVDDGGSWTPVGSSIEPTRPHCAVSRVFNGEYLVVPATRYLDVAAESLAMPEPASTGFTYLKTYSYHWSELPAAARHYFELLPAWRWQPDRAEWEAGTVAYDTNGLVAVRHGQSAVLPRTFFERAVVPFREELLYADYRAQYARDDGSVPSKGYSSLMVSADNGRSFARRATIAIDPADDDLMGEPGLCTTADGGLVCVVRRTDHVQKPMCIVWSDDAGRTWSRPRDLFEFGVWPCLLLLGNGALVLSYGRPGVNLAVDADGTGERWTSHTAVLAGDHAAIQKHTCGYTSILALDDESFLLAYSDFCYDAGEREPCKAILVRRVHAPRAG